MELLDVKKRIHEACFALLKEKVDGLNQELKNYQSASNNETKSSAGDKYETGRAMMHLEKEKISAQLNQLQKQDKVLRQINAEKSQDSAALGSLIQTDKGAFFISVSLGQLKIPEEIFCISPVAPLGQAFKGVRPDSEVSFNGRTYQVIDVC